MERNKNNRQPACPEREAGKGVRRRGQTACCLPSRHSLNGACFCAVKSCSCCARSTRAGGCSREKRHADGFGATFCHQKYHKSGKKANVSTGIDNQVVFLSSSLYKGFRICNWRHRRTKVRFPNHYLVPECLLFPKTVIYRLLHFRSS